MSIRKIDPASLRSTEEEATEAYNRKYPLPSAEELKALDDAHLEFLDMLDEEFGPPSADDFEVAEKLVRELRVGTYQSKI